MVVAASESPPHFDHRKGIPKLFDQAFFLPNAQLLNVTNFIRNTMLTSPKCHCIF
jgi:hypothetical protein